MGALFNRHEKLRALRGTELHGNIASWKKDIKKETSKNLLIEKSNTI